MTNNEIIAVVDAHSAGKVIQGRRRNAPDTWDEIPIPVWNFESLDYRVKPEPREFVILRKGFAGYAGNYEVRFGQPSSDPADEYIKVREVLE